MTQEPGGNRMMVVIPTAGRIAQGMADGATRFLVVSRRLATVTNQLFAIGLPNVDRSIEISSSLV